MVTECRQTPPKPGNRARDAQARYDDLLHQIEQRKAQQRSDREKRASELQEAEADLAKARLELRKGPLLSEIDRLKNESKLEIAAACHAHGKVPSHNVTTEIKDTSVVAYDATRANGEFGYTRMWSIHPDQIKPILKSLAPRNSEVNELLNSGKGLKGRKGPKFWNRNLMSISSFVSFRSLPIQQSASQSIATQHHVRHYLHFHPGWPVPGDLRQ